MLTGPTTSRTTTITKQRILAIVACPKCSRPICTKCRSFSHPGEECKPDLDPDLEANLKKWKIKRCPRCKAGVRKVDGCDQYVPSLLKTSQGLSVFMIKRAITVTYTTRASHHLRILIHSLSCKKEGGVLFLLWRACLTLSRHLIRSRSGCTIFMS